MQKKQYWNVKTLVFMALLIAMHLVLTRVLVIDLGAYRISVGSVCTILAGLWLGPVAGGVCGLCADIIGCSMIGYAVNPFITVAAILWGVLPALAKPLFANRKKTGKVERPVKVLQFGEGNFLRAFVDYWFDLANEKAGWNGKCCLDQTIAQGLSEMINEQEGLYTLYLRGSENGQKIDDKRVISSVSRCLNPYEKAGYEAMMEVAASDALEIIVSNTTEAGIQYDPSCKKYDCPPSSFPAKLTQVLYHRYQSGKKGIIMLACELIDNNGKELLKCVNQYIEQWKLEDGFKKYVNEECTFCGSLVDRIVPGRIRDAKEVAELEEKHGYADPLLDVGEVFGVWVIEGDEKLNDILPFKKAGLSDKVFVVPDMSPYKKRKVRILNGAHTGFVLGAYLAGENIVRDCMQDEVNIGYMN